MPKYSFVFDCYFVSFLQLAVKNSCHYEVDAGNALYAMDFDLREQGGV
jgi:hypothetical protein